MKTLPLAIRRATLADSETISILTSQLGYETTAAEMNERLIGIFADSEYATFVAELGGDVAGVLGIRLGRSYERNGMYGHVLILAVGVDKQGRGVGRALMDAAEKWAATQGAQLVVVNSGNHRKDAHRFYERCGYQATGLRLVKTLVVGN
jgi:GNAT superfamily N-acetyltransferase